jgi:hypothetical protein
MMQKKGELHNANAVKCEGEGAGASMKMRQKH